MPLQDILERGFFPKEIPNPFATISFASTVAAQGVNLPADFNTDLEKTNKVPRSGQPTKYFHARGGLVRRQLSLPNPVLHFLLSRELDTNWSVLQPNIGGTALSATNPVLTSTGRAIAGAKPLDARRELAVQTRLNNRYILKTDISRFYNSIYTHSIPWAIHTKPFAKTNRGMTHLGNRLDCLLRSGQDGQTVGIPIGPDTSLVIAEILMQKCDAALLQAHPRLRGHRFIDDYELGFRTRNEAEDAFHRLETILADYELALNPRKTEILELPCNLETPWVGALRSFTLRTSSSGQQGDLFRFFDLAFELHAEHPEEPVLQFAVGRLRHLTVDQSNWDLFQRLLLDSAVPEPAVLPHVLGLIINHTNAGATPAIAEIEEVVNTLIIDHSTLLHSSEVAWALWACLALGITVSTEAVKAVSGCEDSVVALLALHCEAQGLVAAPLNKSVWSVHMNQDGLYEKHWLLSYEANVKGWMPSLGGGDHVIGDPNFGFLKAAGVSFYDTTLAVPAGPDAPAPVPRLPTPPSVSDVSAY